MAQPTFDQFFSAIAEQESNGRYNAVGVPVNGNRAYGKYQVMDFNIPSWSRKYFGRTLTPQQFLNNPKAQEAIAKGRLAEYYNKYGARGAASAWYSGNPSLHNSTRAQPGGPSIKGYVDSVIAKAYKYPGGGGGQKTSSGDSPPAPDPKGRSELAEDYGFVEALFDSSPELKKLFDKATKGQWTSEKFQAELRDTRWWKSHTKTERDYLAKRYGDPASAKQDMGKAYVRVRQLANAMGLRETPGNKKRLKTWAYNIVAKGWDESQLRYEVGKFVYFDDDVWQGEGGEVQEKLRSYAYDMGIKMSSKWYADRSRNVIRGVATMQDMEDEIRRQAKATYGQWGKQIDAGKSVADLASPYMQSMAQILELPAGALNLFDPTVRKALQYKDPQTGSNAVKPLWQFENELRNDSRWKKTKNAQDGLMQTAHQVLADFGVKY